MSQSINGFLKCICVGGLAGSPASGRARRQHFSIAATHCHSSARPRKQPNITAMSHLHKPHHCQLILFFFSVPDATVQRENKRLYSPGSPGLSLSQLLNTHYPSCVRRACVRTASTSLQPHSSLVSRHRIFWSKIGPLWGREGPSLSSNLGDLQVRKASCKDSMLETLRKANLPLGRKTKMEEEEKARDSLTLCFHPHPNSHQCIW